MGPADSLVVIGAGHGGVQVAASARENGWTGTIELLEVESGPPYQRPPLSKEFMAGEAEASDIVQRGDAFFASRGIRLRHGDRVTGLDRDTGEVELADGTRLSFDVAVLATGSRPRRVPVPGAGLPGVCELRTLSDAARLREAARTARHAVIIGAGFVGLEVASALCKSREVTVAEAAPRVMPRVLSEPLSRYILDLHRGEGVDVRLGAQVEAIEGQARVEAVRLADGTMVRADLVTVGIGAVAADDLARNAGLPCENGVVVDGRLRTADPRIFAIGDCANFPSSYAGGRTRLESLQNAVDQAKFVATGIVGGFDGDYAAVPWFWTRQLSANVQIVGIGDPGDEVVIGASNARGGFSVLRHRGGTVTAVESVNDPRTHLLGRRLLTGRARQVPLTEFGPAVEPVAAGLQPG